MSSTHAQKGFGLSRVELLNWGTFDGKVAVIEPDGRNMLLTGGNESGKSTIVDAVTTIFMSPNTIPYNKAASGGESKKGDRNLSTYLRGVYGNGEDPSGRPVPISLRKTSDPFYSVILAVFSEESSGKTVTLAHFFKLENDGGISKFFVCAEFDMSISGAFTSFDDIRELKRRLKSDGAVLYEQYNQYYAWYRDKLGIKSEQAMRLFLQTISMKTVNDLDKFIKGFILEPVDADAEVDKLLAGFENLTALHSKILREKERRDALEPVMEKHDEYVKRLEDGKKLESLDEALSVWEARNALSRLESERREISENLSRGENEKRRLLSSIDDKRTESDAVSKSIMENGGRRIEELAKQTEVFKAEASKRRAYCDDFLSSARKLLEGGGGNVRILDEEFSERVFDGTITLLREELPKISQGLSEAETERESLFGPLRDAEAKEKHLSGEIESLSSRKGNIDSDKIRVRRELCLELGVDEAVFPFIGELVEVIDLEWEAACEKLMRTEALKIIVPDSYSKMVSQYTNKHHLGTFFKWETVSERMLADVSRPSFSGNRPMLWEKVRTNPENIYAKWLTTYLAKKFSFVCCENENELSMVDYGVLRSGVNRRGRSFSKDDRENKNGRSGYVLGWNNEKKIDALKLELFNVKVGIRDFRESMDALAREVAELRSTQTKILSLAEKYVFDNLDWMSPEKNAEESEKERARLESSSDILASLVVKLETLKIEIARDESGKNELTERLGRLKERLETVERDMVNIERKLESIPKCDPEMLSNLDELAAKHESGGETGNFVSTTRTKIRSKLETLRNDVSSAERFIERKLSDYCNRFAVDARDMSPELKAIDEFRAVYDKTVLDDLPKYELKFASMLRTDVIDGVSLLQNFFVREEEAVKKRIDGINASMFSMDYNPGTFIEVKHSVRKNDFEIRKFREELKRLTSGTINETSEDGESDDACERFELVREMLDRLKGREGQLDADRAWRQRVTDIRNWFEFSIVERIRETGELKERYSSSGGKSGGQQEKLAMTILAAGIAHVFGLGAEVPPGGKAPFRTIIVDEAFSRGSGDFAEYGLKLFESLGVQFIVVTPLMKINVIENFVSSVGYVESGEDKRSRVRMFDIKHFKAEQKSRLFAA